MHLSIFSHGCRLQGAVSSESPWHGSPSPRLSAPSERFLVVWPPAEFFEHVPQEDHAPQILGMLSSPIRPGVPRVRKPKQDLLPVGQSSHSDNSQSTFFVYGTPVVHATKSVERPTSGLPQLSGCISPTPVRCMRPLPHETLQEIHGLHMFHAASTMFAKILLIPCSFGL